MRHGGTVTHILNPHDLFGLLFTKFRSSFELHFGADSEQLEKFWSQFLRTEYGQIAAIKLAALHGKSPRDLDHTIPLVIHGDGVPVTRKKSATLIQWGGLLGSPGTKATQQLGTKAVQPCLAYFLHLSSTRPLLVHQLFQQL